MTRISTPTVTRTSTTDRGSSSPSQHGTRPHRSVRGRIGIAVVFLARLVLAYVFVQSAAAKLTLNDQAVAGFAQLGGVPMLIFVGLLETAGAIGLMVPILSGVAAIGLSALLIIISVVTITLYGVSMAGLPLSCLALALVLVYLRRRQTVRLARFVRRVAGR
ncbi:MAG TPA: DoxX family protein [Microlunatus sp.]